MKFRGKPKFRLLTLFVMFSVVALLVGVVDSHRRVDAEIRLVKTEVESAVTAVVEKIKRANCVEFEGLIDSTSAKLFAKNGRPDAYLTPRSSRRSFETTSIGGLEASHFERRIHLVSFGPESLMDFLLSNGIAEIQDDVDVVVECYSPWRVFAGQLEITITQYPARQSQAFVDLLIEQLDDRDIECDLIQSQHQEPEE